MRSLLGRFEASLKTNLLVWPDLATLCVLTGVLVRHYSAMSIPGNFKIRVRAICQWCSCVAGAWGKVTVKIASRVNLASD